MISSFSELRKSIEPPALDSHLPSKYEPWQRSMEYAQTMALIQIAQELNEIKNLLASSNQQSEIHARLKLNN